MMDGYLDIGCVPENRKLRVCRGIPLPGRFGTVPVGGVRIVEIHIENRGHGFRIVIKTDEVEIIIDIP